MLLGLKNWQNPKVLYDFAYQAFIVQGQDGDRPLSLMFMFLVYQIVGGESF